MVNMTSANALCSRGSRRSQPRIRLDVRLSVLRLVFRLASEKEAFRQVRQVGLSKLEGFDRFLGRYQKISLGLQIVSSRRPVASDIHNSVVVSISIVCEMCSCHIGHHIGHEPLAKVLHVKLPAHVQSGRPDECS